MQHQGHFLLLIIDFLKDKNFEKEQNVLNEEFTQLLKDREDLRDFFIDLNETSIPLPVNVERILRNARFLFSDTPYIQFKATDLIESIKKVENYCLNSIWPERMSECEKLCNCPKCEIKENINSIEEIKKVDVKLVWSPPWTKDMMSEEAKLELNL